ncbi:MAG: ATP-binding protein [Ginsengibacter sp.]
MNKKEQLVFKKNSFLEKELAAKNRELEIEASLERVREKAMAMHASAELKEVVKILFEELRHLDVNLQACLIATFDAVTCDQKSWIIHGKTNEPYSFLIPYNEQPFYQEMLKAWKEKNVNWSYMLEGEAKTKWENFLFTDTEFKLLPKEVKEEMGKPEKVFFAASYYQYGAIQASSPELLSKASIDILQRFSKVFDSCYTRFLDLKKAESQAREAQIEAALEKVRSRSLAMHQSNELEQVVASLFDRLVELGLSFDGALIFLFEKGKRDIQLWIATVQLPKPVKIDLPFDEEISNNAIIKDLWNAVEKSEHIFNRSYSGETKNDYFRYVVKYNESKIPDSVRRIEFESESWTAYFVAEKNSIIGFDSWSGPITSITDNDFKVLIRFARVFEQAYTRFLDLQKAEAQAREAQIEAALEKVRGCSLAMHKSDELKNVVAILFEKLNELGLEFDGGAAIYIFKEGTQNAEILVAAPGLETTIVNNLPYDLDEFVNNPIINDIWSAKETGCDIFNKYYSFEEKNKYFNYVFKYNDNTVIPPDIRQFIRNAESYTATFIAEKNSLLGANSWTKQQFSNEDYIILKRFAKVFEQAYIRFLDLQKAEAQAREAQIEAALERVRSRTLAMQKSDELVETAAVLFKQLIHLGIEPNRLYISLIKDEESNSEFWITDEDGNKVSLAYYAKLVENPSFKKMFNGWKEKKRSIIIDMQGKELENYFHHLTTLNVPFKSGLTQKRRIQYLAYFNKGFIGMASPDPQPAETLQLLERFAYVFNLTYTRFNDLQIAEAHALQAEQDLIEIKNARRKAEEALTELQAAQKQLIQSEKMASLGELTAGIAHEIQNPLNFVNNFSDVNKEMLEELKAERLKPNADKSLQDDLINDVMANEEKINHHGKRADAIVKGMLQHSRKSTGQKEPTDINALCDEYLRLSYHGLRAKDKTFNATMNTNFDRSIGKIDIVAQDIGRVILNLINNAFYACAERSRSSVNEQKSKNLIPYEPAVSLSTKKSDNHVTITVSDNGNGIPQNIVDKIFQPFFTTKPTGQGTGLGLSLAYDIVKAHDGEIKVESKEGEGSEFIIELPIEKQVDCA